MTEVEEKVLKVLARVSKKDPATLKPEQQLVADLGIDSPRALELLCDLEEELQFEAPEDAVARITTVADVLQMVREVKAA